MLRLCNAHYQRQRLGQPMEPPITPKPRGSLTERVLRRLPDSFDDEQCWEWPGKRNDRGYGLIRVGGKDEPDIRVTRVVHEALIGPLEPGMLVMHRCDNPPCVNPRHLRAGSNADNMRDKTLKGRAAVKLTPDQVRAIRSAPRQGVSRLGEQYGISYAMVKNIRSRRAWAWLD